MTGQPPADDELNAALPQLMQRLLHDLTNVADGPVQELPSDDQIARIRSIGISERGRSFQEVVDEILTDIMPFRVRMNHPRWFGFIPSPLTPMSWIGELLNTAHNPHAGSWMQSAGPAVVETELVRWMAEQLGLPAGAGGLFVSGGSMANLAALVVARDQMLTEQNRGRAVAYVSAQTHSSIAKGLRIIGFHEHQIRIVAVDSAFRMSIPALTAAIEADVSDGLVPFVVIASAGTTNTGSIDPLSTIADICNAQRMWMHVDGAYGASIALSARHRHLLEGIERADSVSWDAHKWLMQSYGCGAVLVRDGRTLAASYHTRPEYLQDTAVTDDEINFWDFGPELTRPARAIKLWFSLQVHGSAFFGEVVDHGFRLANWAQDELSKHARWQIVSPAQSAIINFRCVPDGFADVEADALNAAISQRILADGYAGVLTTRLGGRTVLRMCALSRQSSEQDIRETVRRLDHIAAQLSNR
jgi:glutamate/tyrosine decarboxylase-like PLP-dependent enzyme